MFTLGGERHNRLIIGLGRSKLRRELRRRQIMAIVGALGIADLLLQELGQPSLIAQRQADGKIEFLRLIERPDWRQLRENGGAMPMHRLQRGGVRPRRPHQPGDADQKRQPNSCALRAKIGGSQPMRGSQSIVRKLINIFDVGMARRKTPVPKRLLVSINDRIINNRLTMEKIRLINLIAAARFKNERTISIFFVTDF